MGPCSQQTDTMEAIATYFHNTATGFKTAKEFSHEQTVAAVKLVKDADISTPIVRLNGETVVVALRSKTKSVVVSIKNVSGKPINTFPVRKLDSYCRVAGGLFRDDVGIVAVNKALDVEATDWTPDCEALLTQWTDAVVKAFPPVTEGCLAANALLATSTAINTLIANLMLEAMESAETEGMKLCLANRARLFHQHAQIQDTVLTMSWAGRLEQTIKVL